MRHMKLNPRKAMAIALLGAAWLVHPTGAAWAQTPAAATFSPPDEAAMPTGPFGEAVKLGENIFRNTPKYAPQFTGNTLSCDNCHMNGGRLANSSPMWAAYVAYPAYRAKNKKVNTFGQRLQGCFRFSENGKAPPLDSKVMVALESYSFWLSTNAPTGAKMAGRGYPKLAKPAQAPSYQRGQVVYAQNCSLCHGADGAGTVAHGAVAFPAVWGKDSYNWGAGMSTINNAADFIQANMPLGLAGTLSTQRAWDVAAYIDSQDRPQDPRFTGNVAETRAKFHDNPLSLYGTTVNGHVLGSSAQ